MQKTTISSKKAPQAAPFFSQAVLSKNQYLLEISGQIGLDPKTGNLINNKINSQTEQAFKNITNILKELDWTLDNITKVRVFLTSMNDYQEMNKIYAEKFKKNAPARIAIGVKELPLGAKIEIECVAQGDNFSKEAKNKYKL